MSKTGSPIHTEDFRSSAAPPTFKDKFSTSHRRLSFQRCSTNRKGQVFQFTPKTSVPALLHQLSRKGFPVYTQEFRSSAAPPIFKDMNSKSHRRLSLQRCSTNCQGQVFGFTPKTIVPALLHQLSKTGFPIHTKDFRSSADPPTVKDRSSDPHRRLSFQRCSNNCAGQVLQFTQKTFAPALLKQLSRTSSPIHTEDFRSSAAPPTVKDRFSNSHRRLSLQRCSTNCQGQVLQFTPKTFAPALLHQLSRTGFPIHTEDFRSTAAPPTVKDGNLQFTPNTFVPALLHQLSRTGSPIHTEDFRSSAVPPIVKDRFSNSHRRLSFQRCSTNCQGQVLQFTPKTFVPALLHQLSRTGSPIHTEDFRSSAAPPTVKDARILQFTPKTFVPAPPPTQVLRFTPKTFAPALLHQLSRTGSPIHTETIGPGLPHQLSRAGSPIHTENFRSSAAPPTVKDRFSNSHRKLSLQRCSTNCPKTGSPIHTENFISSAASLTVKFTPKTFVPALQRCSTNCQRQVFQFTPKDFRSSAAPPTVKDRFSNSHRKLQRCSTNCQGQVLQFTPKTFAPALLHQLSKTGSPIHTENFRSSAAPPTVKDRFFNSRRRLSFQFTPVFQFTPFAPAAPPTVKDRFSNFHTRSTNFKDVLQFTPKTFVPALLHQLSRTGISNSHRRLSLQRCSTNCQGQDLQFTPKTFVPALLHQLSKTGSPIHTEDFRSSAAPPTVKDRFSNSHRRLSFQRCSTNCQGRDLQFTPKNFVLALLHQFSRT